MLSCGGCRCRNVGYLCSPYRKPLARFLNRHPAETVKYFLLPERLCNPQLSSLFQCILKDAKEAPIIRSTLMQDSAGGESPLITMVFAMQVPLLSVECGVPKEQAVEMLHEITHQGVCIVRTLSRFNPSFVANSLRTLRYLMAIWSNPEWRIRMHDDFPHSCRNNRQFKVLVKVLLQYCRHTLLTSSGTMTSVLLENPQAGQYIQPLFDLLLGFCRPNQATASTHSYSLLHPAPVDLTFLRDFLSTELCESANTVVRQLVLGHFLVQFTDAAVSDDARVLHLRELVLPLLKSTLQLPEAARDEVMKGVLPAYLGSRIRVNTSLVKSDAHSGHADSAPPKAELDAISSPPDSKLTLGSGATPHQDVVKSEGADVPMGSTASASASASASATAPPSLLQLFMDVVLTGDTHLSRSEELRTELLNLSTMFIHYLAPELMDHRKNLIKFAWQHLKSDDAFAKHGAYVNVCRFIEVSGVFDWCR